MKKILPLSLLLLGMMGGVQAQTACNTTITNYPYIENFEGASASNWTSGGTNSSWVLGKPAKSVINTAASGTKSWVTSLTGAYNINEQSYVESPCFNMTNLVLPVIEFKIWWNCEFSYDGAVLQSSIDGGLTWQNVGAKGDPNNWYNDNTINSGPGGQPGATAQGWTGRVLSSNGSGNWVVAKHTLTGLGGKPSVKLRIAFGADNVVQDDGFAFDDVAIFETPANDAGITGIISPVSPVVPGNPTPVSVTVKNYGTSPLTSATFEYSVNGVMQTPFAWTGNVSPNATSTPIQIGTFSFPAGLHTIKTWSKLPNGVTDGNPTNDTTSVTINSCAPLLGNYTINQNAPASATNFVSFSAAAQLLGDCGVSGPVTFNVVPNSGPYNEQVILPAISGTSTTNTVSFNGNNNILSGTVGTTYLGIITFTGADYVRVNNLRIEADPGATSGWGVQLINASDNNIINNCNISLPLSSTNTTFNGIGAALSNTSTAGDYAKNLTIQNNTIQGGYYGIITNGLATGTTTGIHIIGNQILDQTYTGIYVNNSGTGAIVEGNDVSRANRTNGVSFYGIQLVGSSTNSIINKNRVHNSHDNAVSTTTIAYGLYITANASAGNENIIKNNLVYNINNNGGTAYGIYASGTNGSYYYHNTVSFDNPAMSYNVLRGIHFVAAATNFKFINNIISLSSPATTKHGIYLNNPSISIMSDNNDIYVGSTGNIGYHSGNKATIADWKAANTNAWDQNSLSVDPIFVSDSYLQPLNTALNNAGQPVAAVTDAINGVTRSTTTPDIGAFEFTPIANDAGVTAIVSPTSPVTPGSQPVQVMLRNYGTATLTSATIGWSVNNVAQTPYNWTGSVSSLQTTAAPITIGNYTFPDGNFTIKAWSQNPNGAADGLAVNDTSTLNVVSCAPLAGNYTINKNNPTAGTNFQSISAAAQKLNSCGVSAPVTFTVASGTGPYNEQVEIMNVPFASATNTITFEGSGNTVSATPVNKMGVFVLNGSKYVKLNNFVITLDSAATTGWGVQLMNASEYNTISNNIIDMPINSTSSNVSGIVAAAIAGSGGNHANNTKILNNTIKGGYAGVQLQGLSTATLTKNQVVGNQIMDPYFYGVTLGYSDSSLVENNDISRANRTAVSTLYGVQLFGPSANNIISKNRIHNSHDAASVKTGSVYGIYIASTTTVGNENLIMNNAIYNINNNGGAFYALYSSSANGAHFFHNTVSSDPLTNYSTLRGMYFISATQNMKFINNILDLTSTATSKHGIYISATGIALESNNNVFNMGTIGNVGYFTTDQITLANWQAVNSGAYDSGSVAADPMFVSVATGNLKPTAVAMDNIGQPLAQVTTDILGAARNATTPDPGAFEFGVPANDVGITAITVSNATGCNMSATDSVTVTIKNFGTNTQTSIPLTYSVNGVAIATPETYTGSIAPNATDTYTFSTKVNLAAAGVYQIVPKTMLAGDINFANDADSTEVINATISGMPVVFDFETSVTGIASMRKVVNSRSAITEGAAASNGATSTKGMIMDGVDHASWSVPSGVVDPWTNNPDNFAAAYFCFSPGTGAATDSLVMTFDLKQLFVSANANTNFRIVVNGVQVGPTYRPPFTGTPIVWQKIRVDLTPYINDPAIQIGLESSVKEAYNNGNGTANLIDNLEIKRVAFQPQTGVKDATLAARMNVFPNPSTGTFNVELPKGKTYEFVVTDLTGKVLMKQDAKGGNNQLNLETTAKGIYLLKVSGDNGTAVRKLIVE